MGQLNVAAGQLVVAPSRSERTADLLARQEMTRGMTADVMSHFRHHSLVSVARAAERWLGAGYIILVNEIRLYFNC